MIKVETLGMYDIAKINPVLTSNADVANYSFIVNDGITYVIMNEFTGDDAYLASGTIKAGDFLNGYDISAWVNQKLVIDAEHVTGGIANLVAGTSTLIVDTATGKLKTGTPAAGALGFKVTEKTTLTGAAIKARIIVGA